MPDYTSSGILLKIVSQIDGVDRRIDDVVKRLDRLELRFDTLSGDMTSMRERIAGWEQRTDERIKTEENTSANHKRRIETLESLSREMSVSNRVLEKVSNKHTQRWSLLSTWVAVAATWLGLIGKAFGWW